MVQAPTTSLQSKPKFQDIQALIATAAITLGAMLVVDTIYFLYSREFLVFNGNWTEGAFQFPFAFQFGLFYVIATLSNVVFGYLAISDRKWLYFFPACVVGLLFVPALGSSGPNELVVGIRPLVTFLLFIRFYTSALAWLMVALWVTHLNADDRRMAAIGETT